MTAKSITDGLMSLSRGKFYGISYNPNTMMFEITGEGMLRLEELSKASLLAVNRTIGNEKSWPYNMLSDAFDSIEYDDENDSFFWCCLETEPLDDDRIKGINYVLDSLKERERDCVYKYYHDGRTFRDIGTDYGITTERVRQIIFRAFRRMRHPAKRIYLLDGYAVASKEIYNAEMERLQGEIDKAREDAKAEIEKAWEEARKTIDEIKTSAKEPEFDNVRNVSIYELDISVRAFNCLKRAGMRTLGDISDNIGRLLDIRNFGKKTYYEVLSILQEHGLL